MTHGPPNDKVNEGYEPTIFEKVKRTVAFDDISYLQTILSQKWVEKRVMRLYNPSE